jgi:hypothetical protein
MPNKFKVDADQDFAHGIYFLLEFKVAGWKLKAISDRPQPGAVPSLPHRKLPHVRLP